MLTSRVVWRAGPGVALPAADRGALHLLAKATHSLLYLLLIVVVVLGVVNAFVRGYSMFDLFHLPQFGDRAWAPADHPLAWPRCQHRPSAGGFPGCRRFGPPLRLARRSDHQNERVSKSKSERA